MSLHSMSHRPVGKGKVGAKVNVRGGGGGDFEDHKAGEFDDFLDFM